MVVLADGYYEPSWYVGLRLRAQLCDDTSAVRYGPLDGAPPYDRERQTL